MVDRRRFLQLGLGAGAGVVLGGCHGAPGAASRGHAELPPPRKGSPVVISTWSHGKSANAEAMGVLTAGGRALDAVEAGVRVSESDPNVHSVGLGGYPNADGVVQLDAAIMDGPTARAGAVAALEDIENPISVARRVMEKTDHVLLVGGGALRFAVDQGFPRVELLTEEARAKWERVRDGLEPWHGKKDTIGMCAVDPAGNLAVACTTSGLPGKMPGRVGDSPQIGAGLFVDNEVGAASATGIGEEMIQSVGSFLVVENMRRGMTPTEACKDAVHRVLRKHPYAVRGQVAYIALRRDGWAGAFSLLSGFQYAHFDGRENCLLGSEYVVKAKGS